MPIATKPQASSSEGSQSDAGTLVRGNVPEDEADGSVRRDKVVFVSSHGEIFLHPRDVCIAYLT